MGFNGKVILHISGLLCTLCLLSYTLTNTQYYVTILTLSIFLLLQIIILIRFVNATNRQLARFLLAIKHSDFSQSFHSTGINSSFKDLGSAFNELIGKFRLERSDKETQAAYLNAFVEQIPIAVLALHENNQILRSNHAFRSLVQRAEVTQLAQIKDFNPALANCLSTLKPGAEQSLQLTLEQETLSLTLSCSVLRTNGEKHKLISIQNIQNALEEKEMQAWQNLIRVMTHEIMNSITPITSLADTAKLYIEEAQKLSLDSYSLDPPAIAPQLIAPLLEDANSAIQTIGKRSQGLMRFVENYRSLTQLPMPQVKAFSVNQLLQSLAQLMTQQTNAKQIDIRIICSPTTLVLNADPDLMEQALINLMRNSIEALNNTKSPKITITAGLKEKRKVQIDLIDNGSGIHPDNINNIFIPFYTTKRTGSGIGMSIVKQIINLNRGQIKVTSIPEQKTCVTIII